MRLPARFVVLVLFALLTTVAGPRRLARAQGAPATDPTSDPATLRTREHFAEGVKLYDARPPDFDGALSQFRQAYEAKPSAGIKRNIALCLKALHRYPEAMDAFDEVLQEGSETLKPEVKQAVHETLAELDKLVASLQITVQLHASDASRRPPFVLSIDGTDLTPEQLVASPVDGGPGGAQRLDRKVRVTPGSHTITGRALGFQEAKQAVTVEAGSHDVAVTLDLLATALAGLGTLTVRATPATADIAVDGVVLARGAWSGPVGVGPHLVTVSAPYFAPFAGRVTARAFEARVLPVQLVAEPAPANGVEKEAASAPTPRKPPALRKNYVTIGMTVQTESLTQNHAAFADTSNNTRSFGGLTFVARYGRKLGRGFALEMLGEAGAMTSKYTSSAPNTPSGATSRVTVTNWVLAPELTYHTRGPVRFVAGAAVGIEGQLTDASVLTPAGSGATVEVSGRGVGLMGLIEAGVEGGPSPLFFQGTAFGELHGIDATDGGGNPLYVGSSTVRGGLRIILGYEF